MFGTTYFLHWKIWCLKPASSCMYGSNRQVRNYRREEHSILGVRGKMIRHRTYKSDMIWEMKCDFHCSFRTDSFHKIRGGSDGGHEISELTFSFFRENQLGRQADIPGRSLCLGRLGRIDYWQCRCWDALNMIVPASRCLEPSDSTCYTVGPPTRNDSRSDVTNACVQVVLLIAIECWTTCSTPLFPATMQPAMRGPKPFASGQQTNAFSIWWRLWGPRRISTCRRWAIVWKDK